MLFSSISHKPRLSSSPVIHSSWGSGLQHDQGVAGNLQLHLSFLSLRADAQSRCVWTHQPWSPVGESGREKQNRQCGEWQTSQVLALNLSLSVGSWNDGWEGTIIFFISGDTIKNNSSNLESIEIFLMKGITVFSSLSYRCLIQCFAQCLVAIALGAIQWITLAPWSSQDAGQYPVGRAPSKDSSQRFLLELIGWLRRSPALVSMSRDLEHHLVTKYRKDGIISPCNTSHRLACEVLPEAWTHGRCSQNTRPCTIPLPFWPGVHMQIPLSFSFLRVFIC